MSKTIADFEDFIALSAPDAGSAVLQHVLRGAIVRFMRESQIFLDVATIPAQCKVFDYPVPMPDCRRLVSVEAVDIGKDSHNIAEFDETPRGTKFFDWHKDGMYPVIVLHNAPKDGQIISVLYTWSIAQDGCEVPDEIYEEWMEAIKSAALSELLMMPRQEWTQPATAQLHERNYAVELRKAKNRRWSNYSRGPLLRVSNAFLPPRAR